MKRHQSHSKSMNDDGEDYNDRADENSGDDEQDENEGGIKLNRCVNSFSFVKFKCELLCISQSVFFWVLVFSWTCGTFISQFPELSSKFKHQAQIKLLENFIILVFLIIIKAAARIT